MEKPSTLLQENTIPVVVALLSPIIIITILKSIGFIIGSTKSKVNPVSTKSGTYSSNKKPLTAPVITPVSDDFDWKTTKPVQYRPFKNGPRGLGEVREVAYWVS
ncbi:unnamed protein product [Ambrosiozyma monospora]|uniref:Unnamed protein product n=1 Tax=Ambrosiozyma monospora TaxID=43982 RepID=A0ACB5U8L5_AMBMO|nr:unnamed protein product [Ambrosiozyma monospora]